MKSGQFAYDCMHIMNSLLHILKFAVRFLDKLIMLHSRQVFKTSRHNSKIKIMFRNIIRERERERERERGGGGGWVGIIPEKLFDLVNVFKTSFEYQSTVASLYLEFQGTL